MVTTATTAPSKHDKLQTYRAARQKGLDWLLSHVHDDGSIGDPREGFHFYRAPWTFAVTGQTDAATAMCGWIRRNMLQSDGTIGGPFRISGDAHAYQDATLVIGAHMALQYDLSYGLLPKLLEWQDPISGGFACDQTPDGGMSDHMDIPFTCGGGFACLQTGQLDRARAVYGYLKRLYDAQTQLPDRFFYTWSRRDQVAITRSRRSVSFRLSWRTRIPNASVGRLAVLPPDFSAACTWRTRGRSTSSLRDDIRRFR